MDTYEQILDFLQYHPGASRPALMDGLSNSVSATQMKRLLSHAIAEGDVRMEGKARATRYFITADASALYPKRSTLDAQETL